MSLKKGMKCFLMIWTRWLRTNRIAVMIIASKFDALEHAMKLLPINCLQLNGREKKERRERIIPIQNDGRFESLFSCIQFKPISPRWYRYRWIHGLLTPFIRYLWWSGCVWVLWLLHGSSTTMTATILTMRRSLPQNESHRVQWCVRGALIKRI